MGDFVPIDRWDGIDSAGGPLILMPGSLLPAWEGIADPSGGRVIDATFRWRGEGSHATDYDRACDVDGYLGTIAVGDGEALVIGDMSCSTVLVPGRTGDTLLIAKWIWGDSRGPFRDPFAKLTVGQFPEPQWRARGS